MINIDNKEFGEFLKSVQLVYGYDFTEYAEASVKRRVASFMSSRQYSSISQLAKAVLHDERVFEEFIQEVSVTVTEMFRDPAFYLSLRQNVVKRLATYPFIKVWVAGCATGEEVYSIAILLKEEGLLNRTVIYATDINQKSLAIAKEGVYPAGKIQSYTANYLKAGGTGSLSDYYKAKYDSVMFDKSLRQNIVFAAHNLAVDKSFNEFQLIVCRNVLIYFNQELQNKVIHLFYESLCPFGFLALGSKESLLFYKQREEFEEVEGKQKIYTKRGKN